MKPKLQTYKSTFGVIEYTTYGKGKPLLILHGGHSNARETLTQRFINIAKLKIISPSRPGYGNTELKNNQTPEKAASQLVELMEHLGHKTYYVMAVSAAGPTGIALAGLFPKQVEKFILASAVTKRWLSPQDPAYKRAVKLFHPKREKYVWAVVKFFIKRWPKFMITKMMDELSTNKLIDPDKVDINLMKNMMLTSRSRTGFLCDLSHDTNINWLNNISAKTLILHSRMDNAIDQGHPTFANDNISNSSLYWTDNLWGHLIWLGPEAKQIIGTINQFLLDE